MYRCLQVYEYDYGSNNEAVLYGKKAEQACINIGKTKTLQFALILQTQAWSIYYSNNRNDALSEEKFLHAIRIRKELYGERSDSYYGSKLRLGSFYNNIEQYQKAVKILDEVIPLIQPETDEDSFAEAHKYLGETLYYLTRYAQSLTSFEIAVEYYKKSEEQYHLDLKRIYGTIAKCYAVLRNYEEAKNFSEKAYKLALKYDGEKSPATLYWLMELGWTHEYFRIYTEAQNCY
jgi:tetratricopeptide (TPR) repeat protein